MGEPIKLTARDGDQPIKVPTGTPTNLQVKTSKRHVLEVDGIHFNLDSTVLLPVDPDRKKNEGQDISSKNADSLAVIARCLRYAQEHPLQKLLVTGHADKTGSAEYNVLLTQMRADAAHCVLRGTDGKEDWKKLCQKKHRVQDVKQILAWIAGPPNRWDVDPDKIDDVWDKKGHDALLMFQKIYNIEFQDSLDKPIDEDGNPGLQTWGAFFDMYLEEIKRWLDEDDAGLAKYVAGLSYVEPRSVGCGKSFLLKDRPDKEDRRIELVFFDPDEEPKQLDCHPKKQCLPKKCEVFNDIIYVPDYVQFDDDLGPPYLVLVDAAEHPKSIDGTIHCFPTADGSGASTDLKFSGRGHIPLKRIPDTTQRIEVEIASDVLQKHKDDGEAYFDYYSDESSPRKELGAGRATNGRFTIDPPPKQQDTHDSTVVVDWGPFIWLQDPDAKPLKGDCLVFADLEAKDPAKSLPFDAQGRIPVKSIPKGTTHIQVKLDPAAAARFKVTKYTGHGVTIEDAGHYVLTVPDDADPKKPKVIAAGQLESGHPWVLKQVPTKDTTIRVAPWGTGHPAGAGFQRIKHFFVLMLENRSYDHMLGWNEALKEADGLLERRFQIEFNNKKMKPTRHAPLNMIVDVGHEFWHAHWHITAGGPVGDPNDLKKAPMSGFIDAYFARLNLPDPADPAAASQIKDIRDALEAHHRTAVDFAPVVMDGFPPDKLPVLNALAAEFASCDRWFSSVPGPTWPNRLFIHAGTSGGLDDSPTDSVNRLLFNGFDLDTIYRRMDALGEGFIWRIHGQAEFIQAKALKGLGTFEDNGPNIFCQPDTWDAFESHLADDYKGLKGSYTFIEPGYTHKGDPWGIPDQNVTTSYGLSDCQHPVSYVYKGEALIKDVYEKLRRSRIWNESALIVMYDEHGGFYDHVPPPPAIPTIDGDAHYKDYNLQKFIFNNYGVRTPCVIISPLIPQGLTDHTIYDHTSVLATVRRRFGTGVLSKREEKANDFAHIFTLTEPRQTPTTLPAIFDGSHHAKAQLHEPPKMPPPDPARIVGGNTLGWLNIAAQGAITKRPDLEPQIRQQLGSVKTAKDAQAFLDTIKPYLEGTAPVPASTQTAAPDAGSASS